MAKQFHPSEEYNRPPGRADPVHPFQVCPWHVSVLTIFKQQHIYYEFVDLDGFWFP